MEAHPSFAHSNNDFLTKKQRTVTLSGVSKTLGLLSTLNVKEISRKIVLERTFTIISSRKKRLTEPSTEK